ncbi:MAG TPA: MFS transporter, partial [Chloroflexia bacterium]|nr:MFS transporter [Chloroflexia bacterium]
GLAATFVGFFTSLDNYANLLVGPLAGAWSDRHPTRIGRRKPFMLVGAPVAALAFVALPYMATLPALLAAIVVTVVAMALFRTPTVSLLGDLFPSALRSRANGVVSLMGGLAGATSLLLGGQLYKMGVPLPFLAMAAGMLVAVGLVVLTIREPDAAYRLAGASDAGAQPAPNPAAVPPNPWRALRALLAAQDRTLLLVLVTIFCWNAAVGAVQDFFTLYSRNVLKIDPGSASQLLVLFAASAVLFAIPGGLIATRFGRKRVTAVCLALLAGLFMVAYLYSSLLFVQVMLVIAGAAYTTIVVSAIPQVLDAAPTPDVGTYTGLYYIFGSAGGIVGPPLAGQLIDATGTYRSLFLFGPVFLAVAFVLTLRSRVGEPSDS